ncbi:MAG: hypothetical protein GY820_11060 [Gammaproteobacteria bacterium]|nr:hypothetical protein [Gammaproteobacteria bacterium]
MEIFLKNNESCALFSVRWCSIFGSDLTPADFFLWGALKEKLYANSPSSVQELEDSIRIETQNISHETLVKAFQNVENRLSLY